MLDMIKRELDIDLVKLVERHKPLLNSGIADSSNPDLSALTIAACVFGSDRKGESVKALIQTAFALGYQQEAKQDLSLFEDALHDGGGWREWLAGRLRGLATRLSP